MYNPVGMYGFCCGEDEKVYFHAGVFGRLSPSDPPPILGEEVEVEYYPTPQREGRSPKASKVVRVGVPRQLRGRVTSYNEAGGWGFVLGEDQQKYHLHKSEVEGHRRPVPGQSLTFYAGKRQGRNRACHVCLGPMAVDSG